MTGTNNYSFFVKKKDTSFVDIVSKKEFTPGLSALDMAFQCGLENAREIFRTNI